MCLNLPILLRYVCDEDGAVGAILERSSPRHKLTMGEHLWNSRRAPVKQKKMTEKRGQPSNTNPSRPKMTMFLKN